MGMVLNDGIRDEYIHTKNSEGVSQIVKKDSSPAVNKSVLERFLKFLLNKEEATYEISTDLMYSILSESHPNKDLINKLVTKVAQDPEVVIDYTIIDRRVGIIQISGSVATLGYGCKIITKGFPIDSASLITTGRW